MDEDEAALLAELRAISNQSATSRFDDTEDNHKDTTETSLPNTSDVVEKPVSVPEEEKKSESAGVTPEKVQDENAAAKQQRQKKPEAVKPWKQKRKPAAAANPMDNIDIVVATPTKSQPPAVVENEEESTPTPASETILPAPSDELPTSQGGFGNQTSTFQGPRGGDAHDAELLALLKGVSSGAADRFAGNDDDNNNNTTAPDENNNNTTAETDPWLALPVDQSLQ